MVDTSRPVLGPRSDPGRYELRRARSLGGERQEWDATLLTGPSGPRPCRLLLVRPAGAADVERWRDYCRHEVARLRALGQDGLLQIETAFEADDPFAVGPSLPVFGLATGPLPATTFAAWAQAAPTRSVEASVGGLLGAARALDALHGAGTDVEPTCFGLLRADDVFVDDRVRLPVLALLDDFPSQGVAPDRWAFSELVYWGIVGRRAGDDRSPATLQNVAGNGVDIPEGPRAVLARLFTAEVQARPLAPFLESVVEACWDEPTTVSGPVEPGPVTRSQERARPTSRGTGRKVVLGLVALLAAGAGAVYASQQLGGPSGPAYAVGRVTVPDGLIVRSGPGRNFDRIASLDLGNVVDVRCYTSGESVDGPGGPNVVWYGLVSGGYASGVFLSVATNPITPPC